MTFSAAQTDNGRPTAMSTISPISSLAFIGILANRSVAVRVKQILNLAAYPRLPLKSPHVQGQPH
ncbi:hypothetical protein IT575_05000 [bacterium]|nr:hypothetical protein [bacterium]